MLPGINCLIMAHAAHSGACRRVLVQMRKYYRRYPMDVAVVQRIVLRLLDYPEGGASLPDGGILRPRGLQLLGACESSL